VQSASVAKHPRWRVPVFPPPPPRSREPAWLFLSNAWPGHSHVGHGPVPCSLARVPGRPAGPSHHQGKWRSVCWPSGFASSLFLGGLDLLGVALPDHRCKIEN